MTNMVKQSDIVNPSSPEDCASHENTDDDEFEEYSEEEMFIEEESNENLHILAKKEGSCEKLMELEGSYGEEPNEDSLSDEESAEEVPCGDESDGEDSCPEEPNEEDIDEEASDEDPSDVSFEEFYEDSDEEPNGGEPLTGSIDQPPLVIEENKASDQICTKSKSSAEFSTHQCLKESCDLSTDAIVSKQTDDPSATRKKRPSRWDIKAEAPPMLVNESGDHDKKRKTRWSTDAEVEAPLLSNDNPDLNKRRKTRWSSDKTQLNMSTILKLPEIVKDILQKQNNTELLTMREKNDKPKISSKSTYRFRKKLYIPLKEYPYYNFVGLILGPNGNTLKKMEKKSGASILLRGKGSTRHGKTNRNDRDEMHVLIQSDSQTCLDAAVTMVEKLLVPVDDRYNLHKLAQLRELAELRGNLKEGKLMELKQCDICGFSSHPTSNCPLIATTSKTNAESHSLPSFKSPSLSLPPLPQSFGDKPKKEIDPAKLYVGYLPQSVSTDKLKELFLPYGICEAMVMTDLSTGQSKGSGFVNYTNASEAAKAIEKMHGYLIDGKKLAVRIAGTFSSNANLPNYPGFVLAPPPSMNANLFPGFTSIPPPSSNANLPNYSGIYPPSTSSANLLNYTVLASVSPISNANLPNYPGLAAIPQEIHKPDCWPGPPGSMLPESGFSSLKSNYNSPTFTASLPLQTSTSLSSSFQSTSFGKNGYMMDEKNLNATITVTPPPSLSSNRPAGFAADFCEIPEPNCWPILPESDTYFTKSSYNSLKHDKIVPIRSSSYLRSTSQTSMSSSQISGITATSNELASFPGYLKSFDPPDQLDQSVPSSSLSSSRTLHFNGSIPGNQIRPTWR